MSYLTKLVNNAKSTDGFTGRQGREYAQLNRKRKKGNKETPENSNSGRWYLWVGGGLVLLFAAIYTYKHFKGNSNSGDQTLPRERKRKKPETNSNPELQEEIQKIRERNQELKRTNSEPEAKSDLENFIDRVPDESLKSKDYLKDQFKE